MGSYSGNDILNIRLREDYPFAFIGSAHFIVLDCDCCNVSGGGTKSGIYNNNPTYRIEWPQHAEYHNRYIAITADGIKLLD
jgi:hypothetical protein